MSSPMLAVEGLKVEYNGIPAVRGISFEARRGSIVGLLGPNGAGKSSTLGAVSGLRRCSGSIALEGEQIIGRPTEQIVAMGISLVPEGRRIFDNLTVEENLVVGASARGDKEAFRQDVERLFERFPILGTYRDRPAGHLSGGEQQQLAIARALIARPKLLLLDEPSLGLAPKIVNDVFDTIAELREEGVTILLAEQFVAKTLKVADEIHVLSRGTIELSGTPDTLRDSGFLEAGYLAPIDSTAHEAEARLHAPDGRSASVPERGES